MEGACTSGGWRAAGRHLEEGTFRGVGESSRAFEAQSYRMHSGRRQRERRGRGTVTASQGLYCASRSGGTTMTAEKSPRPHRWAPEWIAVLTLMVTIIALGGGLFASINGMEGRLRADMRAMEDRIREDLREVRSDVGTLRERVARLDERVMRLDERVSRLDERVSRLDERVSRLEARFDEEFPPRAASIAPRAADVRNEPATAGGRLSGAG